MSLGQEQPPTSVDDELSEYLVRRFLEIGIALESPSKFPVRKLMPYKPQIGDVHYFGDPGTHNYDAAITSEGFWGLTGTGWISLSLGGGGGGGGSAVDVEDSGVSLTTDVTKLNFTGALVTLSEPVADEITVTIGDAIYSGGFPVSETSSELCPGYIFKFQTSTVFDVEDIDITQLFTVGRRVKFIDNAGPTYTYGQISAINYNSASANDTRITMVMEGGATLNANIDDFCLTTNTAKWSAIASPPFAGGRMNWITSGKIGTQVYWVVVGNNGQLATSQDGGVTWTNENLVTIEHILEVVFDYTNERFMACGTGGQIVTSSDGTTWVETKPTMSGTGSFDCYSIAYNDVDDCFWIRYDADGSANMDAQHSLDNGVTWTNKGGVSVGTGKPMIRCRAGSTNQIINGRDDIYIAGSIGTTFTLYVAQNNIADQFGLDYATVNSDERRMSGHGDGWIIGTGIDQWVTAGVENLNFSYAIHDFAYSVDHARYVCVGDNAQIGYLDDVDTGVADAWTAVTDNAVNPTEDVLSVNYSEHDNVFCACTALGKIVRSSSGTA